MTSVACIVALCIEFQTRISPQPCWPQAAEIPLTPLASPNLMSLAPAGTSCNTNFGKEGKYRENLQIGSDCSNICDFQCQFKTKDVMKIKIISTWLDNKLIVSKLYEKYCSIHVWRELLRINYNFSSRNTIKVQPKCFMERNFLTILLNMAITRNNPHDKFHSITPQLMLNPLWRT